MKETTITSMNILTDFRYILTTFVESANKFFRLLIEREVCSSLSLLLVSFITDFFFAGIYEMDLLLEVNNTDCYK